MKKFIQTSTKTAAAIALIAFSHIANSETRSTDIMISTLVISPTSLSVDYVPKASLIANSSNDGKVFAILSVSGYSPNTQGPHLLFSDKGGVSGRLTFTNTSDPSKSFLANMFYFNSKTHPWINNGPGTLMGTLPDKVDFYITVSDKQPLSAGTYSDIINVTVRNQ
ncbi:UNVERIFIED_ORG: hypothetical protein FHU00_4969 [Citrobacter freundii]